MIRFALLALALSSCVATRSDLDRIHARIDGVERAFESGAVDHAEVDAVRDALADTKAEVAAVAHDVSERGGVAWDTIIYAVGLALGVGVPTSVKATNLVRDSRRMRRAEPVAVPKASKGKGLA